mgnify:CR=1 FL=1
MGAPSSIRAINIGGIVADLTWDELNRERQRRRLVYNRSGFTSSRTGAAWLESRKSAVQRNADRLGMNRCSPPRRTLKVWMP